MIDYIFSNIKRFLISPKEINYTFVSLDLLDGTDKDGLLSLQKTYYTLVKNDINGKHITCIIHKTPQDVITSEVIINTSKERKRFIKNFIRNNFDNKLSIIVGYNYTLDRRTYEGTEDYLQILIDRVFNNLTVSLPKEEQVELFNAIIIFSSIIGIAYTQYVSIELIHKTISVYFPLICKYCNIMNRNNSKRISEEELIDEFDTENFRFSHIAPYISFDEDEEVF